MQLPKQLAWEQASNQWPAILNPVIANPILGGQQASNIKLIANTPFTVYHSLGQTPVGVIVVYQSAAGSVFYPIPFGNPTITIEANANMTVSVWIY